MHMGENSVQAAGASRSGSHVFLDVSTTVCIAVHAREQLSKTDVVNPQQDSVNPLGVGTGLPRGKDGSQQLKAHLDSAKTFGA